MLEVSPPLIISNAANHGYVSSEQGSCCCLIGSLASSLIGDPLSGNGFSRYRQAIEFDPYVLIDATDDDYWLHRLIAPLPLLESILFWETGVLGEEKRPRGPELREGRAVELRTMMLPEN